MTSQVFSQLQVKEELGLFEIPAVIGTPLLLGIPHLSGGKLPLACFLLDSQGADGGGSPIRGPVSYLGLG